MALNATRWYATRGAVKAACGISGPDFDALIDSYIESATEDIEAELNKRFIPETDTKYFRWPARRSSGWTLLLEDNDLLAVTQLQTNAQDAIPITIAPGNYYLEPNTIGPPYTRIEINLASQAAFSAGQSPQRSIAVTGRWGLSEQTKPAGALSAIMLIGDLTCMISNEALIDVGDTLLIESEACFVSGKAGNVATVVRHVNGTIAAQHASSTAIAKYAPPADVMGYVRAAAIAEYQQGRSGWTGQIGGNEGGATETHMYGVKALRTNLSRKYGRVSF